MFEFSNKDLRHEFNKTAYGKKTNKMLYISLIIAIIFFIISCIMYFIIDLRHDFINEFQGLLLNVSYGLTIISFILACYFDGKRDGAIEQFKRDNKK